MLTAIEHLEEFLIEIPGVYNLRFYKGKKGWGPKESWYFYK